VSAPIASTATALDLPAPARRIASLVPSLTETLFDLGAGERVVAVTDWCGPALPDGFSPPRIGGVRDPRLDELLDLRPQLVLASQEENLRDHVEAIAARGVPVLVVDPHDLEGAAATVEEIGAALDATEAAAIWVETIRGAPTAATPRVRALYPIWNDPWMTVGPGSYAAHVLGRAGFELVGGVERTPYPGLDLDRAAAAAPTALLLPDEPFDFHGPGSGALREALAARGLAQLTAVALDGRLAAWYGSRSGRRLGELAALCDRMA